MNIDSTKSVSEIACACPEAIPVFERLGIDYCCGGDKTLEQATAIAGLGVEEVLKSLEGAAAAKSEEPVDRRWEERPLGDLIEFILNSHHAYTRQQLNRLQPLLEKVCQVHAANHPELFQFQKLFDSLKEDLLPHMLKEEQILFPYVLRMEQHRHQGLPISLPMFGTVRNPIRMMMMEHDNAGDLLRAIRATTSGFEVPADGCGSFRALYQGMLELERDLHHHIHLENNILFPRAIQMESGG